MHKTSTAKFSYIFIAVMCTAIFSLSTTSSAFSAETKEVSIPPESLAQWYKPQNKRQVWLHLMFRLGETTQAVGLYSKTGDSTSMARWAGSLAENYRLIPKMVPEWAEQIDVDAVKALETAAAKKDITGVQKALKKIRQSCKSCHGEFKTTSIAIYRSADFSKQKIKSLNGKDLINYRTFMKSLRHDLNNLKIYRADLNTGKAQHYAKQISDKLSSLKESCSSCHRDKEPVLRILGEKTFNTMDSLIVALKEPGKTKKSGQLMGEMGFTVCGRCHGIHRNKVAIKKLLK
ncbi:MAG: cytochrome c [Magnetococcales bacterium]|nr:cytochrome c [Magnetococcales bacterium]